MVKSSNLGSVSSILNLPASSLNTQSFIFHQTSILLNPSSLFHLCLFFLHLFSKMTLGNLLGIFETHLENQLESEIFNW